MDVVAAERWRDDLAGFTEDVFASLTRAGWQERAAWYQQGLLIDGRRKSIQSMAARLQGTVHEQALNHFVTNSPGIGRSGASPGHDRRVDRLGAAAAAGRRGQRLR